MARLTLQELTCLKACDEVYLDNMPGNEFHYAFGAWPDQAYCIDISLDLATKKPKNELLFRGGTTMPNAAMMGGGQRGLNFATQMERALVM